ncbi:hypothetical protein VTJ04DRAFT_7380 [Mycothermus thermophilus]|uniref:uncharacterized protein n=1 Tax=Humicola insolens TaxID=85995 RepID=UPI003742F225
MSPGPAPSPWSAPDPSRMYLAGSILVSDPNSGAPVWLQQKVNNSPGVASAPESRLCLCSSLISSGADIDLAWNLRCRGKLEKAD